MARNEEKAQSMLNRYLQMKKGEKGVPDKRPYLASLEDNLGKAEKWRFQILKEISKKVQQIQVDTLGEHKIRELNDEINKLIREKSHWQRRIIELGGPNYFSQEARIIEENGESVEGSKGYRYFGAARNLPGVKELLKPPEPEPVKRTRGDLYKGIDADYYGFRDEDDGALEQMEAALEERHRKRMREEWNEKVAERKKNKLPGDTRLWVDNTKDAEPEIKTLASLPTHEEMEKAILEKKKQDIIKRFVENS